MTLLNALCDVAAGGEDFVENSGVILQWFLQYLQFAKCCNEVNLMGL